MATPDTSGAPGLAFADIDKVIHEPARLWVMAHLYIVESADFTFLVRQTGLTWGNLSSHLSKLEAASYIATEKEFVGKRPNTMAMLTPKGREAFKSYRLQMKGVLDALPD